MLRFAHNGHNHVKETTQLAKDTSLNPIIIAGVVGLLIIIFVVGYFWKFKK